LVLNGGITPQKKSCSNGIFLLQLCFLIL
jgi:hypothetical protein